MAITKNETDFSHPETTTNHCHHERNTNLYQHEFKAGLGHHDTNTTIDNICGSLQAPSGHPNGFLQAPSINQLISIASLSTVNGYPNKLSRAELTPPTIYTIHFDGRVATIDDIYEDSGSSSDDDGSITEYSVVSSGEADTCNYLHTYAHTLNAEENIFSPTEMED